MPDDGFNLALLKHLGGPVRTFRTDEAIFREGDAGNEVFVDESGQVEIGLGDQLRDKLGENDLFGEMALVDTSPRERDCLRARDQKG
jgi:CRP-like cAMP-binding protein